MDENRTRASLLMRVRDFADRESWDQFVEIYGPLLVRYLRHLGLAEHDAADVAHDVLAIVVEKIGGFEYDPAQSFRGWLKKIARNRAFRVMHRAARAPGAHGGTDHHIAMGQSPDDERGDEWIEQQWRRRRLEVAAKRVRGEVTPEQWETFELVAIRGLSVEEVSARLQIAPNNVYQRVFRVKRRMRTVLEQIDD